MNCEIKGERKKSVRYWKTYIEIALQDFYDKFTDIKDVKEKVPF
jgi:hypothetical protein